LDSSLLVEPGKYSFKIRGIEPPDLARFPADVKKLFWSWVVEIGLKIKAKEILAGIDVTGGVMSISAKTRKRRKSAMTSSGKGDPDAPALIPGWQKSRTYSLLAGRPFTTHAEFYWRYDPWTGKQWGVTLRYLADMGLDTIGLSPQGQATLKVQSWDRWSKYKAGTLPERLTKLPGRPVTPEVTVPRVGQYERQYVTPGGMVLGEPSRGKVETTGLMTPEEWRRYFTGPARAAPPGRPAYPPSRSPISGPGYQRIIGYTWPQGPRRGPGAMAAAGITPGPRIPRKSAVAVAVKAAPAKPKVVVTPKLRERTFEEKIGKAIALEEYADANLAGSEWAKTVSKAAADLVQAIKDHSVLTAPLAVHGMATPDVMRRVTWRGLDLFYTDGVIKPVAETLKKLVETTASKVPDRLLGATKVIYHTTQANKFDAYWQSVYKNFTRSHATGGDGSIAVYNNGSLSLGNFTHEAGHNLATKIYGSADPTTRAQAEFVKAIASNELPVSEYAKNSPAEDFAEASRLYVEDPAIMKRDFPMRYAVIERIMKDMLFSG
jgi:hypothetical protein